MAVRLIYLTWMALQFSVWGATNRWQDMYPYEPEGDYRQWRLSNVNFEGLDLSGANFRQAILDGANFTGANLTGARFDQASLRGAIFDEANLSGVTFREVDLHKSSSGMRIFIALIFQIQPFIIVIFLMLICPKPIFHFYWAKKLIFMASSLVK